MGAPDAGIQAADQPAADTLLGAFKTIQPSERTMHERVLNYWLSIRGNREFPALHELDPLEISNAGPSSVLLELISGGHDAEVRHLGERLRPTGEAERIIDAPSGSILSVIGKKLPIVAISRDFLAFEDSYSTAKGTTSCWVTLLPLSAGGAWIDYVYALVSFETAAVDNAKPVRAAPEPVEQLPDEPAESAAEVVEQLSDESAEAEQCASEPAGPVEEPAPPAAEGPMVEQAPAMADQADEPIAGAAEEALVKLDEAAAKAGPGFSKLFDSLAGLAGFYGQGVKAEPAAQEAPPPPKPVAEEAVAEPAAADEPVAVEEPEVEEPQATEPQPHKQPAEQPAEPSAAAPEASLQTKLTEVRARADEARMAKLRANAALYEGLSAAYDFALDAEDSPEEYLRLVEAQGLKIQLRSPMTPVVKLAFDGLCDESTIGQLEAVLAWALKQDLPRGSLAERIEAAGGIAHILNGDARAA